MPSVLDALDAATSKEEERPKDKPQKEATPKRPNAGGNENAELLEMQLHADLLGMIQADTGEQGTERGGYVAFRACPVCGHQDCMRFYPTTNTWACFGGSNENANAEGRDGGGYLKYLLRTGKASNNTEAVKLLRESTGNDYQPKGASKSDHAEQEPKLPSKAPWHHVNAVDPPKPPPDLISGVLRRGESGLLVSKAKAGKSYTAIEAAVSVACGVDWLGYPCERGRVLFVDPELSRVEFDNRCKRVARAMGVDGREVNERVETWQLDGVLVNDQPPTVEYVAATIAKFAHEGSFDLIVIDSASFLVRGDENQSLDVRRFWAYVNRMRRATGAAALVTHHEGKRLSGDTDAISRARGSTAWGDCPASPLALTEIFPQTGEPSDYLEERERAFVLEDTGMRNHAGVGGRHVIWHWPTHRLDTQGITEGWKPRSSQGDGGRQTAKLNKLKGELRASQCVSTLLAHMLANGIGREGIAAGEAAAVVSEAVGATVKTTTLKAYVAESDLLDVWQRSKQRWFVVPRHLPQEQADMQLEL